MKLSGTLILIGLILSVNEGAWWINILGLIVLAGGTFNLARLGDKARRELER